jgi:hypothetical protein
LNDNQCCAEVAKQADALRSGRSEHYARVGSNPTFGIAKDVTDKGSVLFSCVLLLSDADDSQRSPYNFIVTEYHHHVNIFTI